MTEITCQNTPNIYKLARTGANLSRYDAAWALHISDRTLARYELGDAVPFPEIVLRMQKVYGNRILYARHCSEMCPIGKLFAVRVEEKDLAGTVLGLIKEYNDVQLLKDRLICIACDGLVSEEEAAAFREILDEFEELKQMILNLKLWAAQVLGFGELQKEKPLSAAM